jgi:hypothetical protein
MRHRCPQLRGVARRNANFSWPGFFTSLVNVNGDLFFDQNRITLNNLKSPGCGTVQYRTLLGNGTVQAMNIRSTQQTCVSLRRVRTVIDADLVLRGNWTSPLLRGMSKSNLAYRSDFEIFLAVVTETI